MWFCLLSILILLIVLELLMNYNKRARLIKKMPGPKVKVLFMSLFDLVLSPVEIFKFGRVMASAANGIYGIWIWPVAMVNIYNPIDIEKIISTTKFNDKSPFYNYLKPWLQDGLLVSKGEKWHRRRKILTPAFHFNILKEFCVILEENSNVLVNNLKKTNGQSTDIVPILSEYTLNSICETAMGTRLSDTKNGGKSYKDAIYGLGDVLLKRLLRLYLIPDIIFNLTKWGREAKRYLKPLHEFTSNVIDERREYVNTYGLQAFDDKSKDDDSFVMRKRKKFAMLDLMISSEKNGDIDSQGIQEEVDTFMFEGHDTTASGLTYCLLLLANHKEVQDKVVAELYEVFGDSSRVANIDDFSRLRYMDNCLKESMRLYPPVHFISRLIHEEVTLSNYKVPAGTFCNIHIYDLHRREEYFKNALHFDPDRFLPENSVGRHPYSYIPFSAGPRNCIGQKFAMLELKSCIAAVLRSFHLEPVTRESDLEVSADLVLRNNGPVCVKFIPRI